MSQIFGYISRTDRPVPMGMADRMIHAMSGWKPDATGIDAQPNAILGCLLLHTAEESLQEVLPYTDEEAQMTITADARVDNRDELSVALGLKNDAATPDSLYLLRAFQKWGNGCGCHVLGDYAFAIWDRRKRALFCARDHIGARALFYYIDQEKFIFATEPKGILASGEAPDQLQDDWIANILVNVDPAKDMAPYVSMKKLPPAHCCLLTPEKFSLYQYWDLDVTREIRYRREQDYYDGMRALLEQAIKSCTRSAFPVGAELSGGLDSSGIAAIAQRELNKRGKELMTFSHALPAWAKGKIYPFEDEKVFIQSLDTYVGITQQHDITAEGKGLLDEFRLCNERFGYPTGYPLPVFCDALYEKAQAEGARILLSGFPGDELVTSHGSEFYNELLYQHRYYTLWRDLYNQNDRRLFKTGYTFGGRLLAQYFPGIYYLLKGKPEPKIDWRDNSFRCVVATNDYADKMHLRERIFAYAQYPVFHSVRARERVRITENFVCRRLEQCAAHALYAHLEYRNPLADRRLLEYVLALPPEIKVRNGFRRYPYRMAVAGIIPEDIRWRTSKAGATIPTYLLRLIKDSERINHVLRQASENHLFPSYIDVSKMQYIKQRLDNKQLKDDIYPYSFFSALMLLDDGMAWPKGGQ